MTQKELAGRLQIGQSALARIERRSDILVSTLRDYLSALGATLRVGAHFNDASGLITGFEEAGLRFDVADEHQLVLPIIGEAPFVARRDVVFSIKPEYSEKIVDGAKTIELRRRFPSAVSRGTLALIYATSPIRALTGVAEIGEIQRCSPSEIWDRFASRACIPHKDFESYFSGVETGVAIELCCARPLRRALKLSELRQRFNFEPPQSFLYVTRQMREALDYECSELPNRH
ncbi:helix-turn-helix domain-containing protein [Lichenicola sp.]|uniref:helix-turn-helix domain-containing protein n=1 Tax=Lichenicola sp. TaxID=2804529 RepID=UPI003B00BFD2